MNSYLIEPLTPLSFRSGELFGAGNGDFPLPSAFAGMARTAFADSCKMSFDDDATIAALKNIKCVGTLLAARSGEKITPLLPKPADAIYIREDDEMRVVRLSPKDRPSGVWDDLDERLTPVEPTEEFKGKPANGAKFWPLETLEKWCGGEKVKFEDLERVRKLAIDERTRIGVSAETQASEDGQLFTVATIELSPPLVDEEDKESRYWSDEELLFCGLCEKELANGLVRFGGKRGVAQLIKTKELLPPKTLNAESLQGGVKMTLLTPAIFGGGYLPEWLDDKLEGVLPNTKLKVRLEAVALDRFVPISGWDLAIQKPKPMRKAVAAGSVYWFKTIESADAQNFASVCDKSQDNLDGFGFALISPRKNNIKGA